jgi:hypothetical protein
VLKATHVGAALVSIANCYYLYNKLFFSCSGGFAILTLLLLKVSKKFRNFTALFFQLSKLIICFIYQNLPEYASEEK